MGTRYVPILDCRVGEIFARDVVNSRGSALVTKNSTITEYIKEKLLENGFSSVWIYDHSASSLEVQGRKHKSFSKNYEEMVFSIKELFEELSLGGKLDMEKVGRLGKDLFGSFNDSGMIIKYLLSMIEKSDVYTHSHSLNVALYSSLIAKWLELPENRIQEVAIAGLLHDIGKVMIPTEVLNKKGKLTEAEFALIKCHPVLGYDKIKDISQLQMSVKKAVLLHHERLNGSGYPYGLSKNDLDLCTRIVSIADVYDAMTQNRVYKKKMNPFEAFKIFKTDGLEIFDIEIAELFLMNIAGLLIGLNVVLDNDELGEIVYIPPHDITRPMIRMGSTVIDTVRSNLRIESLI